MIAGRVISETMNHLRLLTESGEIPAKTSGSMFYRTRNKGDLPAVGDWVAARPGTSSDDKAVIHAVLPRRSKFSRKVPGKIVVEQTIAANINTVFIMMGLDDNYNLRRLERFLTISWESGAQPVVLLNKADLITDAETREEETHEVAGIAPVHVISALYGQNLDQLDDYLKPASTTAILGSSGVGKSTLLNRLLGEEVQKTQDLGTAKKGVHTTRMREMFFLDNGAMIIDTPGMRELQLWNVDEGLTDTFSDIEELAAQCRFNDCSHQNEPGCAVRQAVEDGQIPAKRLANYTSMNQELDRLEAKQDKKAIFKQRKKEKAFQKVVKNMKKAHHKYRD